jgi:hypothetical protein
VENVSDALSINHQKSTTKKNEKKMKKKVENVSDALSINHNWLNAANIHHR